MTAAMGLAAVLLAYGVMSVVAYVAYARDKSAARRFRRRTPERTLHLMALLGGWPGALLAQRRLRHKSSKPSFLASFWLTVVLNLALLTWAVSATGIASA
jgi:uncharacterized membrane protein YsdA (DUF1294 family)